MYKECQQCFRKNAIAKKTCSCGYVFLAKKTAGFQELPVILTPERLRQTPSRPISCPIRDRKSIDNSDEFVYTKKINFQTSESSNESTTTEDNVSPSKKPLGKCKAFAEKLYPKRERTARYEHASHIFIKRKTQPIVEASPSKRKTLTGENLLNWKPAHNSNKNNRIRLVNSSKDLHHLLSRESSSNTSLIRSPSVVMLRKADGNFLTENIDAKIEIEINNETDIPLRLDVVEDEKMSMLNDDNVLAFNSSSHKMIVTRTDCMAKENNEEVKPNTIDTNVKKKSVGRPRKHPIKINMKRPVGRPRKYPSSIYVHNDFVTSKIADIPDDKSNIQNECVRMKKLSRMSGGNIKRPVGRPPKTERSGETIQVKMKRPVGRPRKIPKHTESIQVKRPRGRPKGAKDLKQRKLRVDRCEKVSVAEKVTPFKSKENRRAGRCFLSPPSLIASAKRERMKNEMLQTVEKERLKKKLAKDRGVIIPPDKRELYKLILQGINRRMSNQAFHSNLC